MPDREMPVVTDNRYICHAVGTAMRWRIRMRIIISDDHPVVLMGLKAILRDQGDGFLVVGEASTPDSLLDVLARMPCDLLITDFSMPDGKGSDGGLGLLERLRADYPQLPVLVLTMFSNPALVRGMLAVGVRGVVDKIAMGKELMQAIQAIRGGRTYLGDRARDRLDIASANGAMETDPAVGHLTAREAEVVRLLAMGQTVSEIARAIGRSVKTVSQQKRDAMRKLSLEGDSQLYEYVRANGLL
jgi:two-component system capsular synthesis response regulator RcsB